MAITKLLDGRRGKNARQELSWLFRQAVFGRLAGYEDVNDTMLSGSPVTPPYGRSSLAATVRSCSRLEQPDGALRDQNPG
jgi:hypothetical protein